MINNLELIKPILNFENEGDFYMLYIFKRKKDQPESKLSDHQSVRTIKSYCVESVEYLEKRMEEIRQLSEMFKARVYIHIQKQNHKDVSLEMMVALAERIRNGQHNQKNLFNSIVGKLKIYEKRWVVDIDIKDEVVIKNIRTFIDGLRPEGSKCIAQIPTKNGYHLITNRFDVMEFKNKYPEVDIQKKNPALLYYPNSLN